MSNDQDNVPFPELSRASSQQPKPMDRFPDIAGYRVLEELPRGGQAMVYQALHLATQAKVALKVLHPDFHHSSQAKRYFEQEVALAAGLHHPNIVTIRDSGILHGQYYFAMEYIRGIPLDQYVHEKDLSVKDKLVLFTKLCDAMAHAHQRGVMHRDLKPSNILVDERGEPHVLDFGLAKSVGLLNRPDKDKDMPTQTGEIRGTLAYMSPEQAEGRTDLIDVRTDVYSLGIILYRLLTGEFPYDVSGSALKTLDMIRSAEPIRPRKIVTKVDSDVEAIVMKCLAKLPDDRYQSAAALRDEIRRWMDGLPILAKSVSSVYLLRKVITRHRYTSTVVGLLILIILGFSGLSTNLYLAARDAQEESKQLAQQWNKDAIANLGFAQQMTFSLFLDAWRDQRRHEARVISQFLTGDSKEGKGALFLLCQGAPLEDISSLVAGFAQEDTWFAEYVLAEHFLFYDKKDRALDMYRKSLESLRSQSHLSETTRKWYTRQMEARLEEMSVSQEN